MLEVSLCIWLCLSTYPIAILCIPFASTQSSSHFTPLSTLSGGETAFSPRPAMSTPFNHVSAPSIPLNFWRVADNTSHTKFKNFTGFNIENATRFLPLDRRINHYTVRSHLEWSSDRNSRPFISVCGTAQSWQREVDWRLYQGRKDVTVYMISTDQLNWRKLRLSNAISIDVLVNEGFEYPVMFMKAAELIRELGLSGTLRTAVEIAARDEWLA